jgi:hypothetical protein
MFHIFHISFWVIFTALNWAHWYAGGVHAKTLRYDSREHNSMLEWAATYRNQDAWELLGWRVDIQWITAYQDFIADFAAGLPVLWVLGMFFGGLFTLLAIVMTIPGADLGGVK